MPDGIGPAAVLGAVLFDDGQPGPGWASAGDGPPFRVSGLGDLARTIGWWTNVEARSFRAAGLHRDPGLRPAHYLPLKPLDLIDECGLGRDTPDRRVHRLAVVLGRLHRLTVAYCEKRGLGPPPAGPTLPITLAPLHPPAEQPDEIMAPAAADACPGPVGTRLPELEGGRRSRFHFPRLDHAQRLMAIPLPFGPWEWVETAAMGPDPVAWLNRDGRPALIGLGQIRCDAATDAVLAFGSSGASGYRRSWVTSPEFELLSRHADLTVTGAYLGAGCTPSEPAAAATAVPAWSAGLWMESLWQGAAGHGLDRSPDFRAIWLKASDHRHCLEAALALAGGNWQVTGYGLGGVTVSHRPEQRRNLLAATLALGLLPPLSLHQPTPIGMDGGGLAWGGGAGAALEAGLRARGAADRLQAIDDLVEVGPDAARDRILRWLRQGDL